MNEKYKEIIEKRRPLLEIFQSVALNFTHMRKIMEQRDKTNQKYRKEIDDSDRALDQCIVNVCDKLDLMEQSLFKKVREDD